MALDYFIQQNTFPRFQIIFSAALVVSIEKFEDFL